MYILTENGFLDYKLCI